jgi:hypothetical protein
LAKKTKVGAISETEEMLEEKIQEFEELQKA